MSDSSKLRKFFQAVSAILRKPYLLNLVLQSDEYWQKKLAKDFPNFKDGLPQIPLTSLLTESGSTLSPVGFLGGGSMLTDLALLKSLASRITHCTYFEIGTWRGESVSIVASVAQQCVTLNLSSEDMKQRGWPDEYADQHGFFSKTLSNVSHVFGDSKSFDFAQLNTKFDLIFIDGDHHHDYVTNDTNCVFHHLVHKDSVVVWHDYAHSPEQLRPEVLHGILSALPTHCHHQLYHVSNTLCAVLLPTDPIGLDIVPISATKKLKTPQGDWQVRIGK